MSAPSRSSRARPSPRTGSMPSTGLAAYCHGQGSGPSSTAARSGKPGARARSSRLPRSARFSIGSTNEGSCFTLHLRVRRRATSQAPRERSFVRGQYAESVHAVRLAPLSCPPPLDPELCRCLDVSVLRLDGLGTCELALRPSERAHLDSGHELFRHGGDDLKVPAGELHIGGVESAVRSHHHPVFVEVRLHASSCGWGSSSLPARHRRRSSRFPGSASCVIPACTVRLLNRVHCERFRKGRGEASRHRFVKQQLHRRPIPALSSPVPAGRRLGASTRSGSPPGNRRVGRLLRGAPSGFALEPWCLQTPEFLQDLLVPVNQRIGHRASPRWRGCTSHL